MRIFMPNSSGTLESEQLINSHTVNFLAQGWLMLSCLCKTVVKETEWMKDTLINKMSARPSLTGLVTAGLFFQYWS